MERLPPTPYLHNIDISLNSALVAMFLIAVSHCISYRVSKNDEALAVIFDRIGLVSVITIYTISLLFILFRQRRLDKETGNRLFKEGANFFNKMCKLDKENLYFRPLNNNEKANLSIGNVGIRRTVDEF
eukprot:g5294.t1